MTPDTLELPDTLEHAQGGHTHHARARGQQHHARRVPAYDVLFLDVEGSEEAVLATVDPAAFGLIVVETGACTTEWITEWMRTEDQDRMACVQACIRPHAHVLVHLPMPVSVSTPLLR